VNFCITYHGVSLVTGHVAVHAFPCYIGSTSSVTTFHCNQGFAETGIYGTELPLMWLPRQYNKLL